MITGMIILSFVLVERGKDRWATLLIVVGALVKLYPIVGLAFFAFSKKKPQFIIWTIAWFGIMLLLPALFWGSSYIFNSYHQWFEALSYKSGLNVGLETTQDWCLMGVVRRFANNPAIPNLPFFIAGALVFALPFLRFDQYKSLKFRMQVLTSALLMVVLFSTGSEHPTYIIAATGASLYIVMNEKPFTTFNTLFIIIMLITALTPTDVFPRPLRVWCGHYAVKAWPMIIIWFKIAYELIVRNFLTESPAIEKPALKVV